MINNQSYKKEEVEANQDNEYWLQMYEELEEQMKQMMKMTLELIENQGEELQKLKKENRDYKLFEHRIKVTLLGKIALKYIHLKMKLKNFLKSILKK